MIYTILNSHVTSIQNERGNRQDAEGKIQLCVTQVLVAETVYV
jgi:hypothetical protein